MTLRSKPPAGGPSLRELPRVVLRPLASLKLAVVLLVVLAGVLVVGTLIEASHGRAFSHEYVYNSRWFIALVGLLAANILAATLVRLPWKRRQLGFLVTHAGLLVLLVGAMQTLLGGIEGRMVLTQGQPGDRIVSDDFSQFVVRPMGTADRQDRFVFKPGPVDWPADETLDLGEIGDMRFRATSYLAHAATAENYVADNSDQGPAGLKFRLVNAGGQTVTESWLVASPFGTRAQINPLTIELFRLPADTMLTDLQDPPGKDMDAKGVLTIHWDGHTRRVSVSDHLGQKIALDDKGLAVELAEYLPNAKPAARGRFTSDGQEPKNPLLELRVYTADQPEPIRAIAFARMPFQNLDAVHGKKCPVQFWYHHPAVTAESGVQFVLTADGKLYARTGADGKYHACGLVRCGDELPLAAGFRVSAVEYLPHVRLDVSFRAVHLSAAERGDPEAAARLPDAAACLEMTVDGKSQRLWLKRNDDNYGMGRLDSPQGPLLVTFENERVPLGFSLELLKFEHGMNPGGMGDASYRSTVRLVDKAAGIDQQEEISMNQPLVHGKYTFYQSSYDGAQVSILAVSYDPGRLLKYVGSLLLCGGTLLLFMQRAKFLRLPPTTAAAADDRAASTAAPANAAEERTLAAADPT